jgi:hypothetical protein
MTLCMPLSWLRHWDLPITCVMFPQVLVSALEGSRSVVFHLDGDTLPPGAACTLLRASMQGLAPAGAQAATGGSAHQLPAATTQAAAAGPPALAPQGISAAAQPPTGGATAAAAAARGQCTERGMDPHGPWPSEGAAPTAPPAAALTAPQAGAGAATSHPADSSTDAAGVGWLQSVRAARLVAAGRAAAAHVRAAGDAAARAALGIRWRSISSGLASVCAVVGGAWLQLRSLWLSEAPPRAGRLAQANPLASGRSSGGSGESESGEDVWADACSGAADVSN